MGLGPIEKLRDLRVAVVNPLQERQVLKLGYKASAEQFAPKELLDFSCLAEEVGFDSIFVSDHFQPWKHTGGHAPSALLWLRALRPSPPPAPTGTNRLTPTLRHHPPVGAHTL